MVCAVGGVTLQKKQENTWKKKSTESRTVTFVQGWTLSLKTFWPHTKCDVIITGSYWLITKVMWTSQRCWYDWTAVDIIITLSQDTDDAGNTVVMLWPHCEAGDIIMMLATSRWSCWNVVLGWVFVSQEEKENKNIPFDLHRFISCLNRQGCQDVTVIGSLTR